MKGLTIIVTIVTLAFLPACATIISGSSQRMKFDSSPESAIVSVDGQRCQAPCALEVSRGESHIVKIEKNGKTQTATTQKQFNIVSLLNMFNVLGWAIDAMTGALYNVTPETVNANFAE